VATDDMDIVSALHLRLREKIGQQRHELWFGSSTRLRFDQSHLTVEVASPFYQAWLASHFRDELKGACWEVTGRELPVRFRVNAALAENDAAADPPWQQAAQGETPESANGPARAGRTCSRRERAATGRDESLPAAARASGRELAELSSFVVGAPNKLAHTSAGIAAEKPGSMSPL